MTVWAVCLLVCASVAAADTWTVTKNAATGKLSVHRGSGGLATAHEQDDRTRTGWVRLDVQTAVRDAEHVAAAGFLEGFLHQRLTWAAFVNFANGTDWRAACPPATAAFIAQQDKWLRQQAANSSSPYWSNVALILAHYDGLTAGYQAAAPSHQTLSTLDLLVYALQDELPDYVAANQENAIFHKSFNGKRSLMFGSRCSVLIKLTADNLFGSHDTWFDFNSMLRVFKTYHFGDVKVQFSSYPGLPVSGDDYVINQHQLLIVETTLNVFNSSLYSQYFRTESVPYWIRVQLANAAKSGPEWHEIFKTNNNGGYNNEWIIVDFKLYSPSKPLLPNTLVVGEQMPGFYQHSDLTPILRQSGYWASYNVPYFPEIYQVSGTAQMFRQYGDAFSWSQCPRAKIYRRDQAAVTNLAGMKKIQRSNRWQTDSFSLGSGAGAVSARADLNSPYLGHTFAPFGGLDCKITDSQMISKFETEAVCGPTWDSQPIFWWNDQYANYPTLELPRVYNFDFVRIKSQ